MKISSKKTTGLKPTLLTFLKSLLWLEPYIIKTRSNKIIVKSIRRKTCFLLENFVLDSVGLEKYFVLEEILFEDP